MLDFLNGLSGVSTITQFIEPFLQNWRCNFVNRQFPQTRKDVLLHELIAVDPCEVTLLALVCLNILNQEFSK